MIKFLEKNKFQNPQILHQFQNNETLEEVLNFYNAFCCNIKKDIEIYNGQCLLLNDLDKKFHIVKPLETLDSIALKYQTSVSVLQEKNHIKKVFVGQIIEL